MPRIVPRIVSAINSPEPSFWKFATAPFLGLALCMFLPAIGVALSLHALWKWAHAKFA